MEKDTLHRAANTINQLLKAHVSDEAEKVNVYDAMAIRDDLRELAEVGNESDEYDLPEVGDTVFDVEHNQVYGSGFVEVTEVLPNRTAKLYYFDTDTGRKSVAYENPEYDEEAPIVKGTYVGGSDKEYAFPADRLT